MNLPGKNVLIIAAICISVIFGAGAYKIAQAARTNLLRKELAVGGIVASSTDSQYQPGSKLLNALQQIELDNQATTSYANPFAPAAGDTMTDTLSKNFFTSYAQTQGDSADSAGGNDTDLVNNALASVDTSKLPKPIYTANDLNIIAGNTSVELKAYGNNFVSLQNSELLKIQQNPAAYQNDVSTIAPVYAAIAAKLVKIPVPVSIAAEHLAIVNDYYLSSEDFKLIASQSKDPLKALLGLRQYKDSVGDQQQMYTDIQTYLQTNGILFSNTEPGYFWTLYNGTSTSDTSSSVSQ